MHKAIYQIPIGCEKVIRAIMNGYRNRQFGLSLLPNLSLGYFLVRAIPLLSSGLKNEMRSLSPALPGQTLLDVGCGDGKFLALAQQMGWTVTGLEPDPSAARNARAKGIMVIEGDISALANQVACFDVITCSHVIEHVHDPVAVLQAMHRLLKPGGSLWIETPNIDSLGHAYFAESWRGLEPPRHLVLFNHDSLNSILYKVGFAKVEDADANLFQYPFIFAASRAIKSGQNAATASLFDGFSFTSFWFMLKALFFTKRREYISLLVSKQ